VANRRRHPVIWLSSLLLLTLSLSGGYWGSPEGPSDTTRRGVYASLPQHPKGGRGGIREIPSRAASTVRGNSLSDDIFTKVRINKTVRVIAHLRVPSGFGESRERRILAVQQAVLGELVQAPHQLVRNFQVIPAIALVSSETRP